MTAIRVRLSLIMMIFAYPLVTVLLYAIVPLTEDWQTWQRTLALVPIMVVIIVFVITPTINRHFGRFISGPAA